MTAELHAHRVIEAIRKIGDAQPHATDSMGWPICECAECLAKSKRMNDAHTRSVWAGNHDPERVDLNEQLQRDHEWDRNNGFVGE